MTCQKINKGCNCDFNLKSFGLCDPKRIIIDGSDRTVLNWNEISVPEILCVPEAKPDIENLDQIYANAELTSVKLIETPFSYEKLYVLAPLALVTQVQTIVDQITTLIGATGTIAALFTPTTGVIPLLLTAFPLVTEPSYVTDAINAVDAAVFNLTEYISNLVLTGQVLSSYLCTTLKDLTALLEALVKALQGVVDALTTFVLSLISLTDPAFAAIATALDNVGIAVDLILATIDTIVASIASLITSIGPVAYITTSQNEEGTCLSGRKLIVQGFLNQKVVYTGDVDIQSVHSAHYSIPFSVFIVVYPKFENLDYQPNVVVNILDENGDPIQKTISGIAVNCDNQDIELVPDLCEEFCVEAYIEDIFATALDPRTIFKNVTLFFLAKPSLC